MMLRRWYECVVQIYVFTLQLLLRVSAFAIDLAVYWEEGRHHQLTLLAIRFQNLA